MNLYHPFFSTTREHISRTFIQDENDLDVDAGNERICEACRLPIFSTPYETNTDGHFLHKCCVNLPQILTKNPFHPTDLHLHKKSSTLRYGGISCFHCMRKCREGFFYQCPDTNCWFTIHVSCDPTSIKIVHRSHNHELVPIPSKSNLFTCMACGLKQEDEMFYQCDFSGFCNFYLHRDCASLPNTIRYSKHEQHPLCLTYDLPENSSIFQKSRTCSICHEELSSNKSGMYFCLSCNYNAHIRCIISEPTSYKSESSQNIIGGLVHLPIPDERTSLLRHLFKHKIDHGSNSSSIGATKEEKKLLRKEIHSHSLILVDDEYGDGPSDQLCNACIQPISSLYYTCTDPQCNNIYFHDCCTNLPLKLYQYPAHKRYSKSHLKDCGDDRPLRLLPRLSNQILSMVWCDCCNQPCNGFVYSCDECPLKLDVRCALLPEAITYEGHGKSHVLFLSWVESNYWQLCNCCGFPIYKGFYYECCSCPNLRLDARCALLPSSVSHKFDRHPLKLISPDFLTPKDDDRDFCEICEEGVVTANKSWLYHCKECATSFHISCIPSVGPLSNIKFGETIRVRCHDCPLNSIRILTNYKYECGVCKWNILGRTTELRFTGDWRLLNTSFSIAFECIKCCFWLCWRCAKKNWVKEE